MALVSGGGSGHEPLHAGFVGHGMLDAACPGQVFTSPTPDQIEAAARAVDAGKGVLFIVKNYSGDVMNFEMAAESFGGQSASVLVQDDVAVESSTFSTSRRGVAGTLVVEKIVGAAAEAGADLGACTALAEQVAGACARWGSRWPAAPCPPPASRPSFSASPRWRWASASTASPAAAGSPRSRRRGRGRAGGSRPAGSGQARASRCCS